MHEGEPKKEREATIDGITEALKEGDRAEGWRLFDEWEQRRIRENDEEPESFRRLAVAVEALGFHVADGQDAEVLAFETFTVGSSIRSDSLLSDDQRSFLMKRFAEVTAGAL